MTHIGSVIKLMNGFHREGRKICVTRWTSTKQWSQTIFLLSTRSLSLVLPPFPSLSFFLCLAVPLLSLLDCWIMQMVLFRTMNKGIQGHKDETIKQPFTTRLSNAGQGSEKVNNSPGPRWRYACAYVTPRVSVTCLDFPVIILACVTNSSHC